MTTWSYRSSGRNIEANRSRHDGTYARFRRDREPRPRDWSRWPSRDMLAVVFAAREGRKSVKWSGVHFLPDERAAQGCVVLRRTGGADDPLRNCSGAPEATLDAVEMASLHVRCYEV
ncbi:unnamed protein product [Scytosiphon promiscuus]